ncbi:hypothetical protein Tco_1391566 [Tanacetum coccineum]
MKAVRSSSHVSIVPSLSSSSHIFASPMSDRGNMIRRMPSFLVSLYLNISHIPRNSGMCFCGLVLILPSNWFPLTRVKWLPLMANSFAVSGMVIAEPGVRATTRSATHIGSSSIGLWFVSLFEWKRCLQFRVHSGLGSGSTSSELEARVCIQGTYMVQFARKLFGDFEKESG